jgi:putative transposase
MSRLTLLCGALLKLSLEHGWHLQAWAIFPNHYHFVAVPASDEPLRELIRHFHSLTAREVNKIDRISGRKVWFQYWETSLTYQKSYFARLHYVYDNAVRHGLVRLGSNYPWCSAGWFERKAAPSFLKLITSFPIDRVAVVDPFEVAAEDVCQD